MHKLWPEWSYFKLPIRLLKVFVQSCQGVFSPLFLEPLIWPIWNLSVSMLNLIFYNQHTAALLTGQKPAEAKVYCMSRNWNNMNLFFFFFFFVGSRIFFLSLSANFQVKKWVCLANRLLKGLIIWKMRMYPWTVSNTVFFPTRRAHPCRKCKPRIKQRDHTGRHNKTHASAKNMVETFCSFYNACVENTSDLFLDS